MDSLMAGDMDVKDYPDYPFTQPEYSPLQYQPFDTERRHNYSRKPGDKRSEFEIDRSRIIHSSSFRRLQGKTQVYTPEAGDFHRTRLTHSLEVAQIAKGLALQLGADPDLLEAISLAHDLGHPPFGHAGEEALEEWMLPHGGFEQNAQSFRIVTRLEAKFPDKPKIGLNLTRGTLDGILKYKTPFSLKRFQHARPFERKFYYAGDKDLVRWACGGTLPSEKSFECQIMDWADDLAYAVHDLEDAIHFGLITSAVLSNPATSEAVLRRSEDQLDKEQAKSNGSRDFELQAEWERLRKSIKNSMVKTTSYAQRRSRRRDLTSRLITHFILNVERGERPKGPHSNESDRYRYTLNVPDRLRACQKLLTSLVWEYVIESRPGLTLQFKSKLILDELWKAFVEVDADGRLVKVRKELLPQDWSESIPKESEDLKLQMRGLCDFLAGMTDEYARRVHEWLYDRDEGWHPHQLP